jgi:hypothetical protein
LVRLCSLPAIEDIRDCLKHTSLHRKFVATFRQALLDRLLHPGTQKKASKPADSILLAGR